jgi:hypothetical protein
MKILKKIKKMVKLLLILQIREFILINNLISRVCTQVDIYNFSLKEFRLNNFSKFYFKFIMIFSIFQISQKSTFGYFENKKNILNFTIRKSKRID